ncbi:hypothetical protein BDZ89DRAFT_1141660 [Hymenopellis radicata]|nr:hypothetical protein BDZ89DRAFT_1141660 [Hymenopellis radicata]
MPFALYSDSDHYSLSDVISVLSANGMEVQGRELCLSDGSETLTEFFFALTLALDSDGASSVSSLSDDSLQHIDSPTVNVSRHSRPYEAGDLIAFAASKKIHIMPTDGHANAPTALVCAICTEAIVGPGYSLPITLLVEETPAPPMVSATSTVVASVTAPGIASVAAPVTAPVTTPIPAPVVAPVSVAAPVSAPVTVPVSAPVTAPIPAPVIAPVSVTVPVVASVTASVTAPVSAPVTAPVSAPVTAPVTVPFTAPIQAPVVAPQVNQLVTTFGALGFGQPPVVPPATVLTPAGPIPAAAAAAMDDATHNALNAVTWDTPPLMLTAGPGMRCPEALVLVSRIIGVWSLPMLLVLVGRPLQSGLRGMKRVAYFSICAMPGSVK